MKTNCHGVLIAVLLLAYCSFAAEYQVGPGQPFATIGSVPALQPGDIVDIFAGTYNEVVRWTNPGTAGNPITIRGMGATRPVVDATGFTVDGVLPRPRAVFQVEASYIIIQNLEFVNARNGDNGSGIRVTSYGAPTTNVTIDNCMVDNNDMGIMSDSTDNLLIQSCDVGFNGTANRTGYSHNFYLGGTKSTIQSCYIHDSLYGQNFKTRGHYTELLYNFIANSQDGEVGLVDDPPTALPNSNAVMIGNLVVAKPRISGFNGERFIQFGQDSGGAHNGTLNAINNTFVAGDSRINFLDANISGASIVATNNIFYNSLTLSTGNGPVSGTNNWAQSGASIPAGMIGTVLGSDPSFVNPGVSDYHLTAASPCINIGANSPTYLDGNGVAHSAVPTQEYVLQLQSAARSSDGQLDDGAYEFNSGTIAPAITTQPASQTVNAGQTASFSVAASGTAPLTYQWQKNSVNISGATGASYTTPGTATADSGSTFRCVVSNTAGSATSNAAVLTVNASNTPPAITSAAYANPNPALAGKSISFSVAASDADGDTLTYSWAFGDGGTASGAAATHAYTAAGTYTAKATVSDGAANSAASTVTVTVNANVTPTLHVAGITMSLSTTTKGNAGIATVSITNANGTAVSGATVAGNWSGLTSANVSGNTGSKGNVKFTSSRTKSTGTFTFTVTNVTAPGYTYAPSQNAATSGSITTSGAITLASAPTAAAPTGTPVAATGAVSLGSVKANQTFKLALPRPADIPQTGTVSTTSKNLPTRGGVRVSGGNIGGKARHAGAFTFTVQFKAKTSSVDASGVSTPATIQTEQQYTLTVTP